jgi:hypothetical protein
MTLAFGAGWLNGGASDYDHFCSLVQRQDRSLYMRFQNMPQTLSIGADRLNTLTAKKKHFPRRDGDDEASRQNVLYAHGEMYGQVTVTQGSPYIGNAVTHPRCMF